MKINILGAPGTGATTLGKLLALDTGFTHLDSDSYFWSDEGRPYEFERDKKERDYMLTNDFNQHENIILTGAVFNWKLPFLNDFDLVVFLYLPKKKRIERLLAHEKEYYGDLLETDKWRKKEHHKFMECASRYDEPNFESSQSLREQSEWINQLISPVIRFEREYSFEEMIIEIKKQMRAI